MSEYTDDMLDGVFCECCGEYLGEGYGAPRRCRICDPDHNWPDDTEKEDE